MTAFNDDSTNLEIVAEECAEVIHIKSKIARFGIDDCHPASGKSNRARLEEELGHVMAMIDILIDTGMVTCGGIAAAAEEKQKKLVDWYRPTRGEGCGQCDPYSKPELKMGAPSLYAEIQRLRAENTALKNREKVEQINKRMGGALQASNPTTTLSRRGRNWLLIAPQVLHHIEKHYVPQYGDEGEDHVSDWTTARCAEAVRNFISRHGRGSVDQDRTDLIKVIQYASIGIEKLDREAEQ